MTMRYMPYVQAAHSHTLRLDGSIDVNHHGLVMGIADSEGKKHLSIQPRGNYGSGWCPSYFYNSVSLGQSRYCDVTFNDVGLQDFPSEWTSDQYYWSAYSYDEQTGLYHNYYSDGGSGEPCWCDDNNNELTKSQAEDIINQKHTFEHKQNNDSWVDGLWIPTEDNHGSTFEKNLNLYLGVKTNPSGTIYHEYFNDDWSVYEYEEITLADVPEDLIPQVSRYSRAMQINMYLFDSVGTIPGTSDDLWGNEDVVPDSEREPIEDGSNFAVTITLGSDFEGAGLYMNNSFYTQNYWIFQKVFKHNPLPCDIQLFPVNQKENFINSHAIYYETTYYGYHIAYAKMGRGGSVSINGREDIIEYTPYYLPY